MKKHKDKKLSKKARALRIIGIILAILLIQVLFYVIYVFTSSHRIEDFLKLDVKNTADQALADKNNVPVDKELKITSYNIGFGAYSQDYDFFMDGGTKSRALSEDAVYTNVGGAADVIFNEKPDFAFFQEVDFDSTRAYHVDERDILSGKMGELGNLSYVFAQNYDSPYLAYPFNSPHGKNKSGIMSFSLYNIQDALRRSVPIEKGFSRVLDLDRCYSKSYVRTDGTGDLVLYNLHLSAYTSKAETAENQVKQLVADMKEEYDKGNYVIAGGDFNRDLLGDSPSIFHTETIEDNWAKPMPDGLIAAPLSLVAPFDEANPTATCRDSGKPYYKGMFVVTLDGFIVSDNIEVINSSVIDTEFMYSDHNPVYMTFKLK